MEICLNDLNDFEMLIVDEVLISVENVVKELRSIDDEEKKVLPFLPFSYKTRSTNESRSMQIWIDEQGQCSRDFGKNILELRCGHMLTCSQPGKDRALP